MATITKVFYVRDKAVFSESFMSDGYREPQYLLCSNTSLTDKEVEKIIGEKARKICEESIPYGLERFFYWAWTADQSN